MTTHRFITRTITTMFFVALCVGCEQGAGKSGGDAASGSAQALAVVVSGDTGGWITPCGCASNQSGGMARRGTYLADLRNQTQVIYMDAGGAAGGVSDYHKEKFEAILRGELAMQLKAHNIGHSELALGLEYLRKVGSRLAVPFISANLLDEKGELAMDDLVIIEAAGRKLAITGVISPRFVPSHIKSIEPRQAVLDALQRHRDEIEGAAIWVLAYLPEDELHQLAAALPEADAIIGGPTGQAMSPKQIGPVTLAAATNKGKFLIRLNAPAASATDSRWQGEAVEMGPTLADDAAQLVNLKAYLTRLGDADFAAADTALVPAAPAGAPADFRIAGSAACATCHVDDHAMWHASKHGHAMDTLRTAGFHVDSYCQSCHTTGFAQPGGFDKLSNSAPLFGVGCENCHGPSSAHVKDPTQRTPWLAADQCVRCHDHENSPQFEQATYWTRILHGKKLKATGSQP